MQETQTGTRCLWTLNKNSKTPTKTSAPIGRIHIHSKQIILETNIGRPLTLNNQNLLHPIQPVKTPWSKKTKRLVVLTDQGLLYITFLTQKSYQKALSELQWSGIPTKNESINITQYHKNNKNQKKLNTTKKKT